MSKLKNILDQIEKRSQPPVHLWQPKQIGDIDIRIDSQGDWLHEGKSIKRVELVRLFASILWQEQGQHYLVTPVEKLAIAVDDAAYVIQQVAYHNHAWVAVTNTQEQVVIGTENPVELREYADQWLPYVRVRYDLWGRVSRGVYYQWVSTALDQNGSDQQQDENTVLTLVSQGYEFEVARR